MPLPMLGDEKLELLRDKISKAVRDSIAAGALKDGEQLVEAAVAKKLNVSRAAVREAFWVLERQGYVRIIPHRGAFVREPSRQEQTEIFEILIALEPLVAGQARLGLLSSGAQEWRKILAAMQDLADRADPAGYFVQELLFHQRVWRVAGNRKIEEVLDSVCPALFTSLAGVYRATPEGLAVRVPIHLEILAALESTTADPEQRVRAALQHLSKMF